MNHMKTEDFLKLITTINIEYPGSHLIAISNSAISNENTTTIYCYDLEFAVDGTDKVLEVTVNKKTGEMVDSKFIENCRAL